MPDVSRITGYVEQVNSIKQEIVNQLELTKGMNRIQRITHIATIIHSNYPNVDINAVKDTIENLIDLENNNQERL